REACPLFVTGVDGLQVALAATAAFSLFAFLQLPVKIEHSVARYAEDVTHAAFEQLVNQEIAHGVHAPAPRDVVAVRMRAPVLSLSGRHAAGRRVLKPTW